MALPICRNECCSCQGLATKDLLLLVTRPTTVQDLVNNIFVVWNKKLLAEPTFYEKSVLLQFFGEASISFDAPVKPSAGWSIRTVHLLLDKVNFPSVVATLRYSHRVSEQQRVRSTGVSVAAYVENTGQINKDVESVPAFTWAAAVKRAFGPGATIRDESQNYHGGRSTGTGFRLDMQYLYANDDVSKFSASDLPGAWFLLIQGAIPAEPGKVHNTSGTII
jgi:hypothetical protein